MSFKNMNKLQKLISIVLIISGTLVLAAGSAWAGPLGPQWDKFTLNVAGVQYYLIGHVSQSDDEIPVTGAGRTIRLFPEGDTDPTHTIESVTVKDDNSYTLNIFANYIIPTGTYSIEVVKDEALYYAGPAQVEIKGGGWDAGPANLKLVKEEIPPANTVKLTISRENKDITITWGTPDLPNIYYLVGDGTGKFTNTITDWQPIDFNTLPANNFEKITDPASGKITGLRHLNQVGKSAADGAIAEVYYKGLAAGTLPTDIDPVTKIAYLAEAWAVGKVDFTVNSGLNLVAVPFFIQDSTIDEAIGPQLPVNSVIEHYTGTGYYTADYLNDNGKNKWVNLKGIVIKPSFGFWIKSPSSCLMTLTGNVLKMSQVPYSNRNIDIGLSLFGLPHPKTFGLGAAGLVPNKGDVIEKYTGTGYDTADYSGAAWINQKNILFEPAKGYWYKRQGATGFKWEINPYQ